MNSYKPTIRKDALVVHNTLSSGGPFIPTFDTPGERTAALEHFSTRNHVLKIETCTVNCPGWRTPNAMALETGNASFDSSRVYIGTGNVMSDTMYGTYVRPRQEVFCNGRTVAPGQLQKFDLELFKKLGGQVVLKNLARWVEKEPRFETTQCLAYVLFHHRNQRLVIHGALVTDVDRRLLVKFDRTSLVCSSSSKSDAVLNKACFYLTDACIQDRETVWTRH